MRKLKTLLLSMFALMFFMTFSSFSQLTSFADEKTSDQSSEIADWQLVESIQGINIYSSEVDCYDELNGINMKLVLLKIENTVKKDASVSWDNKLYYDGTCKTCEGNRAENHKIIVVKANQSISGSCDDNDHRLSLYAGMLDAESDVLTKFMLANLSVEFNQ